MVEKVTGIIQEHLGDTATTLFFLMGAMTIVEIVDQNGKHYLLQVRKVSPEVRDGRFRIDFVFKGVRPGNIRTGQTGSEGQGSESSGGTTGKDDTGDGLE